MHGLGAQELGPALLLGDHVVAPGPPRLVLWQVGGRCVGPGAQGSLGVTPEMVGSCWDVPGSPNTTMLVSLLPVPVTHLAGSGTVGP